MRKKTVKNHDAKKLIEVFKLLSPEKKEIALQKIRALASLPKAVP